MVELFLEHNLVVLTDMGWRSFRSHFCFLLISVPTFTFTIWMELLLMVGKYGVKNLQRKSPVLLTAFSSSSSSSSGRLSPGPNMFISILAFLYIFLLFLLATFSSPSCSSKNWFPPNTYIFRFSLFLSFSSVFLFFFLAPSLPLPLSYDVHFHQPLFSFFSSPPSLPHPFFSYILSTHFLIFSP